MREDLHKIKVGDICDLKNGFAFKSKDYIGFSNTMNFRMSQIRPGGKVNLDHNPTYLPDNYTTVYSDYLLKDGDVVIAMTDMASDTKILGVPTLVKKDDRNLLLNQRVGKFIDLKVDIIHIPYLRYIITSPQIYAYYKKLGKGGMQINLGKNDVLNAEFTLAPLPEQRAIVAKIEELFSSLDQGISDLKKAQEQLKVYRQAVLKKAFEGELTREWREKKTNLPTADELLVQIKEERKKHYDKQLEDWKKAVIDWEKKGKEGRKPVKPQRHIDIDQLSKNDLNELASIPTSWKWVKNNELIYYVTSGSRDWKKYYSETKGTYFVRTGDINTNKLNLSGAAFVDLPTNVEGKRSLIEKGDLLMTITGANVGKIAHVDFEISEAYVSQSVALLKYVLKSFSPYLHYYFQSSATGAKFIGAMVYGVGRPVLSLDNMRNAPVSVCSFEEQHQIVQEIESRLSVCDNVESSIKDSLKKAKALRQSILKKAFEGTLLSAEEIAASKSAPDYEPASVLLEKIRKEKK